MPARAIPAMLAVLLALAACSRVETYRIGVQDTASRAVLAEIMAVPLRASGARVVPVPCGGMRQCVQMLRAGEIDLLPGYTGDAVVVGRPADADADADGQDRDDLDTAREAFAHLDLQVLADFGFEAPNVVVVSSELAERRQLHAIEDLAGIVDGLRIAVSEEYPARPRDGLAALLRRHGITTAPDGVVVHDDAASRIAEIRAGRVHAAVVRAFDQDFAALGLTPLADTLSFFPRYRAIGLAGPSAEESLAWLRQAIQPVAGRIEAADVGAILRDIEVRGWSTGDAARRALARKGLGVRDAPGLSRPPTRLAYDPQDALGPALEIASRVIVDAFPDRPVELLPTFDPFASLRSGRADIAVADSGRFFLPDQPERFARLDPRAEAASVLGQRYLVALRRGPALSHRDPLRGPVGLPPESSTAARVGAAILAQRDRQPAMHEGQEALIRALRGGEIDAAVLLATPEGLADTLAQGGLAVRGLTRWVARYPLIFNEARLPPGTFPGQTEPMDTPAVQLVLAGPAPLDLHPLRAGGPAGAGLPEIRPLTIEEARALVRAGPAGELPDPVLQTIWERAPAGRGEEAQMRRDIADTVVNVLVLAFVGWCLILLIRRERTPPADHQGGGTAA